MCTLKKHAYSFFSTQGSICKERVEGTFPPRTFSEQFYTKVDGIQHKTNETLSLSLNSVVVFFFLLISFSYRHYFTFIIPLFSGW